LASYAKESQSKNIEFNQPSPTVGAKIGYPIFYVDGCAGKKGIRRVAVETEYQLKILAAQCTCTCTRTRSYKKW
jgi:hypothetical protein